MKISDLYNEVLTYILSINISNKSSAYTQSGYLAVGGTPLRTFTKSIQYCPSKSQGNVSASATATQTIRTSETISSAYRAQAPDARITSDWNSFKNNYISKMLNPNETISLSSVLIFIYLVRCFIDARFTLFTDTYHCSYVWLYNTSTSVDYKVNTSIAVTNFSDTLGVSNLSAIITALADEISSRRSVYILQSASYISVS